MVDRGCRGRGTWEGNERPGDREYRPVLFQLRIGLWEGHRLSAYGRSNSFSCVHGDPREGSSGSSVRTSVVGRGPCRVLESPLAGGPEASDLLLPPQRPPGTCCFHSSAGGPSVAPAGAQQQASLPRDSDGRGQSPTYIRTQRGRVSLGAKNNNMKSLCWAHGQVQRTDPGPTAPCPCTAGPLPLTQRGLAPARSPGRVPCCLALPTQFPFPHMLPGPYVKSGLLLSPFVTRYCVIIA